MLRLPSKRTRAYDAVRVDVALSLKWRSPQKRPQIQSPFERQSYSAHHHALHLTQVSFLYALRFAPELPRPRRARMTLSHCAYLFPNDRKEKTAFHRLGWLQHLEHVAHRLNWRG